MPPRRVDAAKQLQLEHASAAATPNSGSTNTSDDDGRAGTSAGNGITGDKGKEREKDSVSIDV